MSVHSEPGKVEFIDDEYDADEDNSNKDQSDEDMETNEAVPTDKGQDENTISESQPTEAKEYRVRSDEAMEVENEDTKSEAVEPSAAPVMTPAERMRMRNLAAAEYFRKMKEEHARNEREKEKAREQLDKEVEKHPSTSPEKAQQSTFYLDKAKESIEGSLGNDGEKQQIDQHYDILV